jgi:hypothetical protein
MRSAEQGSYRNTDVLFLGIDRNQQGLNLENMEVTETLIHCSWGRTATSRD